MRNATSCTSRRATVCFLLAWCIAGCGSSGDSSSVPVGPTTPPSPPNPPPSGQPGLHLVSANNLKDTIFTRTDSISFELRDQSSRPLAGSVIHLVVAVNAKGFRPLSILDGSAVRDSLDLVTTPSGRVSLNALRTRTAGTGLIRATTGSASDSVTIVTVHGNPRAIAVAPRDTALLVGESTTLRVTAFDLAQNPFSVDATLTPRASHVVADGAAGVKGASVGPSTIVASLGTLRDSTTVSVVPDGVIAADSTPVAVGVSSRLMVFRTNGRGMTTLPTSFGAKCGLLDLVWLPDRSGVVYSETPVAAPCSGYRLFISPIAGAAREVGPDIANLSDAFSPSVSQDGAWIYFTAGIANTEGASELWRVRPDGTAPSRVGPAGSDFNGDSHPSPSPDGRRLVYFTDRLEPDGEHTGLRILDLATGTTSDLGIQGSQPHWSPRGDLIAFVADGAYCVVRPDGSGQRVLAAIGSGAGHAAASWSPDGAFLVVSMNDESRPSGQEERLAIVDVATGALMPLGWTYLLYDGAWQP